MMNGQTKFPFTAAQWQELEHQALIYKYMASRIPIPPDLLYAMKRSYMDSPFSSKIFPCQPSPMGWSCFQLGLGRKIDPEPGRCRRTDGKKWRCSKEAYPDSKYCERHMHRGKNRSRKPVELTTTPPKTTSSITSPSSSTLHFPSITKDPSSSFPTHQNPHSLSLFSPEAETLQRNPLCYDVYKNSHHLNCEFMPSYSSSSRPGFGVLDSGGGSSLINTEYRNRSTYGLKEEINEHAFFSEPSGSIGSLSNPSLDDTWQLTPLTMSSSSSSSNFSSSKQRNLLSSHNEYSYLQLQSLSDHDSTLQKQYHHSFLQESDYLKGSLTSAVEKEEPQKTVHRFIEEWPPKTKEYSLLDLEDKSSSASVSTTRLSISIPSSTLEFPIFNSRLHKDG